MSEITRNTIALPEEVASEILAKTQEQSAVMKLARKITLPGPGVAIPVITADPEADWVDEAGLKPVSRSSLAKKKLIGYKLAVIEPFSEEFTRDARALYDALVQRLPGALAAKFDKTVFGNVTAPGENFDTLADATAQSLSSNAYAGLVAADGDIATHGGITNGFVLSPQGKSVLLSETDEVGRPLFINSVAEGAIPMILGAPCHLSKGAYKAASGTDPAIVGVVGDWSQAVWGTVEDVKIKVSDTATLTDGDDVINLWQQNMVAVMAEIEIGFVCDDSVFNLLTVSA